MISIVIPMYNEEKIAAETIKAVREYCDKTFPGDYEAIFVDDGSRDLTLEIAKSHADGERIKTITYSGNRGKGFAVRTGMLAASGEYIFFTDCDLAYGLEVISSGLDILKNKPSAGVVIGSRRLHPEGYASYTKLRKLMSGAFFKILTLYGGIHHTDCQSGIKGFRKSAAKSIFEKCETNGFAFDFEILLRAEKMNINVEEMPVKIINHRASTVNVLKDSIKMLREVRRIKKSVK
ncbi:dolichol-phosphate mannosyltransferase [Clostridia bacterium]|nr:dolichol-phosphate mannosyltransferase [Clostridia bacterium]